MKMKLIEPIKVEKTVKPEMVNHPNHYMAGDYECKDVEIALYGIEAYVNHRKMSAFEYLFRADKKNGIEDYKKAINNLQEIVDILEG